MPGRPVLLLVFDVDVLGVDDAFVLLLLGAGRAVRLGRRTAWCTTGRRCIRLVEHLCQLVASLGQLFVGSFQFARRRRALESLLGFGQRRFDLGLVGRLHLFAGVLQHLLDVVDHESS